MSNDKKNDAGITSPSEVSRRTVILGVGALGAITLAGGVRESMAQQGAPAAPAAAGSPVQFSVAASHLKVSGERVIIKDPDLVTTMARYGSDQVRKELGENKAKVKIAPSDITIDAQGQVVISNPAFAKTVDDFLKKPSAAASDTNYCCKCNAYKCGGG
jgi:hypothetical protein